MKIAFITFEYPPFIMGGAGVYASNLTRGLAHLDHEVHVIMPMVSEIPEEPFPERIHIHKLNFINKPYLAAPSFWYSLRKEFPSLRRQVKEFDVVHINGLCDFSLDTKLVTSPRILTIHHLTKALIKTLKINFFRRIMNLRGEAGIMPFFEKLSINRADKIVAVSRFTRQSILETYNLPENKIEVIHHGAYPEDYIFTKKEGNGLRDTLALNSQPILLFVGRLEARKGLDILLKAVARVLRLIDVKLVVVGAGNQISYQKLVESLNISDKVVFSGHVPGKSLRLIYSICDLFVFPSRMEGFGIAPLEAMAAGKPVVATKVGGLTELIEQGQNGFLVEPGNEFELAEAIIKIVTNNSLVKNMGENNLIKVRNNFTWPIAAQKVDRLYKTSAG